MEALRLPDAKDRYERVNEQQTRREIELAFARINNSQNGQGNGSIDIITPEQYGAVGDGVTDDTAAWQAAVNAVSRTRGGAVFGTPGMKYKVTTILLPKDFDAGVQLHLVGNGCWMVTTGANQIFQRRPDDQTEADTMIDLSVFIRGFKFSGDNTAGSKGIELGATYGSVIRDNYFSQLDVAVDLQFCLMALVESCRAANCATQGFSAAVGAWTGATSAISQSNHTVFRDCRVYAAAGADNCFYVAGSSGCAVDDCITEGGNPVDNVKFDSLGATNVKYFRVRNLHSENVPTGAIVRVIPNGGTVIVDGIYHQSAAVFIDDTGTVGGSVLEVSIPYIPAGSQFKAGGSLWVFHHVGSVNGLDLSNTAYWVGGTLPIYWYHTRFNSSGGNFPEFQGVTGLWFKNAPYMLDGVKDSAGNKVVIDRQAAIADPDGTLAGDTATIIAILGALRNHGLIAT